MKTYTVRQRAQTVATTTRLQQAVNTAREVARMSGRVAFVASVEHGQTGLLARVRPNGVVTRIPLIRVPGGAA
ncbi:MAG TPA: hypothetical protein VEA38_07140 [Terriglobales bacterium]|nr:hypothetical protein [Terriglobales bacterium]